MIIRTIMFFTIIIISTQLHASAGKPAIATKQNTAQSTSEALHALAHPCPGKQENASPLAQLYETKFAQEHAVRWKTISKFFPSLDRQKNRIHSIALRGLTDNKKEKMACACKSPEVCDCNYVKSISWLYDDKRLAIITKHRVEIFDTYSAELLYDSMRLQKEEAENIQGLVLHAANYWPLVADVPARKPGSVGWREITESRSAIDSRTQNHEFEPPQERDFLATVFKRGLVKFCSLWGDFSIAVDSDSTNKDSFIETLLKEQIAKNGHIITAAASSDGAHLAFIMRARHTTQYRPPNALWGRYWSCDIYIVNTATLRETRIETPIRIDGQEKNNDAPLCQLSWSFSPPQCTASIDHMMFTYNPQTGAVTSQLDGHKIEVEKMTIHAQAYYRPYYDSAHVFDATGKSLKFLKKKPQKTPNIYAQSPEPTYQRTITSHSQDALSYAQWCYPDKFICIAPDTTQYAVEKVTQEQLGLIHFITDEAKQFKEIKSGKRYCDDGPFFSLNIAARNGQEPQITAAELARVTLTLSRELRENLRKQVPTLDLELKYYAELQAALQIVLGSTKDIKGRIGKELEEFHIGKEIPGRKHLWTKAAPTSAHTVTAKH